MCLVCRLSGAAMCQCSLSLNVRIRWDQRPGTHWLATGAALGSAQRDLGLCFSEPERFKNAYLKDFLLQSPYFITNEPRFVTKVVPNQELYNYLSLRTLKDEKGLFSETENNVNHSRPRSSVESRYQTIYIQDSYNKLRPNLHYISNFNMGHIRITCT